MEICEQEIIERLVQLPEFSSSQSKTKLLNFFFECYKKNVIPSEMEIAIEVFDKDDHFDPTIDPIIRVYISKIRKIIHNYYENEGKDDKLKVNIPNRKYVLEFYENKPQDEKSSIDNSSKNKSILPATISIITVLVFIIIFLLINTDNKNQNLSYTDAQLNNLVWSPFLLDDFPILYIVGNLFTYKEYNPDTDTYRIVRDYYINNSTDLENYLIKFPRNEKVYIPNWEIIPKSSLTNYMTIYPLFSNSTKKVEVKTSSEFEFKDVASNNIIFIGHFHNLGNIESLFPNSHFKSNSTNLNYSIFDSLLILKSDYKAEIPAIDWTESEKIVVPQLRELIVNNGFKDTLYSGTEFKESTIVHDYVVVSKVPGPNGNSIVLIISFSSLGRQKVIDLLLNSNIDDKIMKFLPQNSSAIPNYFEMLIEVEGLDQEAIEFSIHHFFAIDDKFKIYD